MESVCHSTEPPIVAGDRTRYQTTAARMAMFSPRNTSIRAEPDADGILAMAALNPTMLRNMAPQRAQL